MFRDMVKSIIDKLGEDVVGEIRGLNVLLSMGCILLLVGGSRGHVMTVIFGYTVSRVVLFVRDRVRAARRAREHSGAAEGPSPN